MIRYQIFQCVPYHIWPCNNIITPSQRTFYFNANVQIFRIEQWKCGGGRSLFFLFIWWLRDHLSIYAQSVDSLHSINFILKKKLKHLEMGTCMCTLCKFSMIACNVVQMRCLIFNFFSSHKDGLFPHSNAFISPGIWPSSNTTLLLPILLQSEVGSREISHPLPESDYHLWGFIKSSPTPPLLHFNPSKSSALMPH